MELLIYLTIISDKHLQKKKKVAYFITTIVTISGVDPKTNEQTKAECIDSGVRIRIRKL